MFSIASLKSLDMPAFPFSADPNDHCETSIRAYRDILPLLQQVCQDKRPDELHIYDPYYCNGATIRNLVSLGFTSVYNCNEDCYQRWSSDRYPKFDVLITNPPYSGDHLERLVRHVTSPAFGKRAWFLLLPNFVVKKDYYRQRTDSLRPFYLVPKQRYVYLPPPDFRKAKKSDVHKKSSPFVSMWYIYGGTPERTEQLMRLYEASIQSWSS